MIVPETNRVKQFLLRGYWQNLEQLSNFAFNDHSKSSRKWSNTALVFSNQIVSISFSAKGMENENKIIPQSVSLLDKLIFTNLLLLLTCISIELFFCVCAENLNNF